MFVVLGSSSAVAAAAACTDADQRSPFVAQDADVDKSVPFYGAPDVRDSGREDVKDAAGDSGADAGSDGEAPDGSSDAS